MNTRRFNWIILLIGGLVFAGIGVAGLLAGASASTAPWFASSVAMLVGAIVLRRMRLP